MRRWVIAHDDEGYHVRETLSVTHDGIRGEAVYYTKPKGSSKSLRGALRIARKIESKRR